MRGRRRLKPSKVKDFLSFETPDLPGQLLAAGGSRNRQVDHEPTATISTYHFSTGLVGYLMNDSLNNLA